MPPQTLLLIDCSPADAELWLDGHWVPPLAAVATAASFEVEGSADGVSYRIAEGPRRLELRRAGYYPHRRDLKVSAQRSYRLEVDLVRVLE